MELSILNPQVTIQLPKETVEVHELSWPDALLFYRKLKEQSRGLVDDRGNLVFDANKILDAIEQSVELTSWLAEKSTGKPPEWIAKRSLSEMLEIVGTAVEINLGVIAARVKKVKGRLREVIGGPEVTPK